MLLHIIYIVSSILPPLGIWLPWRHQSCPHHRPRHCIVFILEKTQLTSRPEGWLSCLRLIHGFAQFLQTDSRNTTTASFLSLFKIGISSFFGLTVYSPRQWQRCQIVHVCVCVCVCIAHKTAVCRNLPTHNFIADRKTLTDPEQTNT